MRKVVWSLVALAMTGRLFGAGWEIHSIPLKPVEGMTRAVVHWAEFSSVETDERKGVLVLCPGCNGDGKAMMQEPEWQRFAARNHLGLMAISFASDVDDLRNGRGYYYAKLGSGQLLLDAVERVYGKEVSLVLFGFSGGAHFVSRFEEWAPARVRAWCAYSAGWWDLPLANRLAPPGLVVCGSEDERLGASLSYFKQGRAVGKQWLWLEVPGTGHRRDLQAETFVRRYLESAMHAPGSAGAWVDVDSLQQISSETARAAPAVSGWMPDERLLGEWRSIQASHSGSNLPLR